MSTVSTGCPNGHVSGDPEWCDTCGAPMQGGSSPAAPAPAPASRSAPTAQARAPAPCPHCAALNAVDALFCESCGYDFVTGQRPDPVMEPVAAPVVAVVVAVVEAVVETGWIVVVEVDPVWNGLKGELADRRLPPSSTSTVPIVRHVSLIGRTSQSRGLRPEVALDADSAVSRRHAQLIVDGDTLSVADLSSTNGTYVLRGDEVPTDASTPIVSGAPVALHDGDRLYLGAWSRLTVRRT